MDADEAERQRIAGDDQADDDTRLEYPPTPGARSLVAQTKSLGSYPTAGGRFHAVTSGGAFGPEVEGGPGTVDASAGDTFYALNLGTVPPPAGTNVLITFVEYRWVFRYDG